MNDHGKVSSQGQSAHFIDTINQRAKLFQSFALFSGIPLEDCAKIVALAREGRFSQGKAVFFAGDPIRQVVLLTSGCVKVSQTGREGEEVILRLVGPGETLCVECFPKYTHCATAWAVQHSTALLWEPRQFQAIAERFPGLGRNVSCVLLKNLSELEVRFREISTEKVAPRLSSQLLRLVDQVGKDCGGHIEIALSQRDLAQLTATTLFTVNRLLNDWEQQGIVRPGREALLVLNLPALRELSQSEQSE